MFAYVPIGFVLRFLQTGSRSHLLLVDLTLTSRDRWVPSCEPQHQTSDYREWEDSPPHIAPKVLGLLLEVTPILGIIWEPSHEIEARPFRQLQIWDYFPADSAEWGVVARTPNGVGRRQPRRVTTLRVGEEVTIVGEMPDLAPLPASGCSLNSWGRALRLDALDVSVSSASAREGLRSWGWRRCWRVWRAVSDPLRVTELLDLFTRVKTRYARFDIVHRKPRKDRGDRCQTECGDAFSNRHGLT